MEDPHKEASLTAVGFGVPVSYAASDNPDPDPRNSLLTPVPLAVGRHGHGSVRVLQVRQDDLE